MPASVISGVVVGSFPITVDYTQSLAEMVAAGTYDDAAHLLSEVRFPPCRFQPEVEAQLVHYPESPLPPVYARHVLGDLEHKNLLPASVHELVSFGAQHPSAVPRACSIVELGSIGRLFDESDDEFAVSLFENLGTRIICSEHAGRLWHTRDYFLAVPK
jgi:hypothetical protein